MATIIKGKKVSRRYMAGWAPEREMMGFPQPDEQATDLAGGADPDEQATDLAGGAEPDEEFTDIMGGPDRQAPQVAA